MLYTSTILSRENYFHVELRRKFQDRKRRTVKKGALDTLLRTYSATKTLIPPREIPGRKRSIFVLCRIWPQSCFPIYILLIGSQSSPTNNTHNAKETHISSKCSLGCFLTAGFHHIKSNVTSNHNIDSSIHHKQQHPQQQNENLYQDCCHCCRRPSVCL